jgi:hypothetical protein
MDADLARVGPEKPRGHRERCGLTGTVRPDEAVERSRRNRQLEVVHGDLLAEPLAEVPDLEGVTLGIRNMGKNLGWIGV